jgi:OHCU decarboxylase
MNNSNVIQLNSLTDEELIGKFFNCCGCNSWVKLMLKLKPFHSVENILDEGNNCWWKLNEEDWKTAFLAHPKIGEKKLDENSWEKDEQSGINNSAFNVLEKLKRLNLEYEIKFGFIFLICASGKTAEEMLAALEERIQNDAITEVTFFLIVLKIPII